MYTRPPAQQNQPAWLLPVAIGSVVFLAIVAGLLFAVVLGRGGQPTGAASPTPSVPASAMTSASGSPGDAAATTTPSPTPASEPVISNRALAEVMVDRLNMREAPGEGSTLRFQLDAGRRLFIIGQPTEVGALRWYRVGVLSDDGCVDTCAGIGWVATPITGERWIEEIQIDCPPSSIEEEGLPALGALQPLEMLHCYGSSTIQITGTVETPCCGWVGPYRYAPEWLAHPLTPAFLNGAGIGFRHDPSVQLDIPERGDVVRVTGHFEDAAAPTCRGSVDPEYTGEPIGVIDQALIVLGCRATFVWESYDVIGHKELPPCC